MLASVGIGAPQQTSFEIIISTNQVDYNLFTACGSPGVAVTVVCTINAGVTVSASSPSSSAFTTGGFVAGSSITIVNNGKIHGAGGLGGNGANAPLGTGNNGGDAGNALDLQDNVTLTNSATGAEIFGGGGGGAGGDTSGGHHGAGGGGGQGEAGGMHGAQGTGTGTAGDGTDGSASAAGVAGSMGNGGAAADGGTWGSGGHSTAHASGGNAGKGVAKNGHTITWTDSTSFNSTHLKGGAS